MKYSSRRIIEKSLTYRTLISFGIISEDILKNLKLSMVITKKPMNSNIILPNGLALNLDNDINRGSFLIENSMMWMGGVSIDDIIKFMVPIILSKQKPSKLLIFDTTLRLTNPIIGNFCRGLSDSCKSKLSKFFIINQYESITFYLIDAKENMYRISISISGCNHISLKTEINYHTIAEEQISPGTGSEIVENFLEDINIDEIQWKQHPAQFFV